MTMGWVESIQLRLRTHQATIHVRTANIQLFRANKNAKYWSKGLENDLESLKTAKQSGFIFLLRLLMDARITESLNSRYAKRRKRGFLRASLTRASLTSPTEARKKRCILLASLPSTTLRFHTRSRSFVWTEDHSRHLFYSPDPPIKNWGLSYLGKS